jgi:hypothetical protein
MDRDHGHDKPPMKRGGCEYREVCPCASGWCMVRDRSLDCIPLLQSAYARLLHTTCSVAATLDNAVGRLCIKE